MKTQNILKKGGEMKTQNRIKMTHPTPTQPGESQVFLTARGERVFFCTDPRNEGPEALVLAYASDGGPTDGSEYLRFPSLEDAQDYVRKNGLAEE